MRVEYWLVKQTQLLLIEIASYFDQIIIMVFFRELSKTIKLFS